jgi:DNA-binding IclR family transcriptional regulator
MSMVSPRSDAAPGHLRRSSARKIGANSSMSSLGRMLATLDLFTVKEPTRTIDDLIAKTGFKRATLYRYVRELGKAGLLVKITGTLYALGPRFIEIDRQIRLSDPLLKAGQPLVSGLLAAAGETVILCSLLRDSVVCIHQQRAADAPPELDLDRGHTMPLFLSASAKVILAFLPTPRLRRLYENRKADIGGAGLGRNWEGFKTNLRAIRRGGYAESHGEMVPGMAGIAVPVLNAERDVLGSLAFVIPEHHLSEANKDFLVAALINAGGSLSESLARLGRERDYANGSMITVKRSRTRAKTSAARQPART